MPHWDQPLGGHDPFSPHVRVEDAPPAHDPSAGGGTPDPAAAVRSLAGAGLVMAAPSTVARLVLAAPEVVTPPARKTIRKRPTTRKPDAQLAADLAKVGERPS